jgi:hypothetical protein
MSGNTVTLEEERREAFDGVLESLRVDESDGDRLAACTRLLRHLARTDARLWERHGPIRVS